MWRLRAEVGPDNKISEFRTADDGGEKGLLVEFYLPPQRGGRRKRDAINDVADAMRLSGCSWIDTSRKKWTVDASELKRAVPELSALPWLTGNANINPEYDNTIRPGFLVGTFHGVLSFEVSPDTWNEELTRQGIGGNLTGMDKRYQVFVSSTFVDLQVERQHSTQALLALDCIPSGMELFPASDDDQWTLIKRVIDDCDYYLLILAGRYGSTGDDGFGFTEKEYDYAVSVGKPVVAFLHGNPGSLAFDKSEQDPKQRKKLDAFRAKAKRKMVQWWNSPEDLAAKISTSLPRLIKSHPAEGWVRGRFVADQQELAQLRSRVAELESQLSEISLHPKDGHQDFSPEALTILREAAVSASNRILATEDSEGYSLSAGEFEFQEGPEGNPRMVARYKSIIRRLQDADLIAEITDGLYEMTEAGYQFVERLDPPPSIAVPAASVGVQSQVTDWMLTFRNEAGQDVETGSADYAMYFFNLALLNEGERSVLFDNLELEFVRHQECLLLIEPSQYTGQQKNAGEYLPPLLSLVVPARQKEHVTLKGKILRKHIPKLLECNRAYLWATTKDGQRIREVVAELSVEGE